MHSNIDSAKTHREETDRERLIVFKDFVEDKKTNK